MCIIDEEIRITVGNETHRLCIHLAFHKLEKKNRVGGSILCVGELTEKGSCYLTVEINLQLKKKELQLIVQN